MSTSKLKVGDAIVVRVRGAHGGGYFLRYGILTEVLKTEKGASIKYTYSKMIFHAEDTPKDGITSNISGKSRAQISAVTLDLCAR